MLGRCIWFPLLTLFIVSGRARQLNHKLGNRKNAILRRRETDTEPTASGLKGQVPRARSSPISPAETNGYSKQLQSHLDDQSQSPPSGFTAVNVRQSADDTREPDPRLERLYTEANTGNVTIVNGRSIKGASPTLRAALMKRFFQSRESEGPPEDEPRRSSSNAARTEPAAGYSSKSRGRSYSLETAIPKRAKEGSTVAIPSTPASLLPQIKSIMREMDDGGPFKSEMVLRMEVMDRGTRVIPPCDRCRRLHMDCLKNLTACLGCTKKHAKCSWRDVRVEELQRTAGDGDSADQPVRFEKTKDDELKDILGGYRPAAREHSPVAHAQSQPPSHADSIVEIEKMEAAKVPEQGRDSEERTSEKAEEDRPRFDVRPPPMAQGQANARGQYTPFSYYPQVKDSIEHDENDEGDRLQALAAQVYRSASQSVRPQTQEG